jgi:hypothetical protein
LNLAYHRVEDFSFRLVQKMFGVLQIASGSRICGCDPYLPQEYEQRLLEPIT